MQIRKANASKYCERKGTLISYILRRYVSIVLLTKLSKYTLNALTTLAAPRKFKYIFSRYNYNNHNSHMTELISVRKITYNVFRNKIPTHNESYKFS